MHIRVSVSCQILALNVVLSAPLAAQALAPGETPQPERTVLAARLSTAGGRERLELLVERVERLGPEGGAAEAIALGEEALALLPSYPDPGLELRLRSALLSAYLEQGNPGRAIAMGERLRVLARSTIIHGEGAQHTVRGALVVSCVLLLAVLALLFHGHRLKLRQQQMGERLDQEREVSARLREVDKLKDEFLAHTSHALRTPLFGIIGLAETMRDTTEAALPFRIRQQLGAIVAAGHRLQRLVGDVVDFSRMNQGELVLNRQALALGPLVGDVLALLAPLAEGKGLPLVQELPEDLPVVEADKQRLEQILLNLVGNAIKFTDRGQVTVLAEHAGEGVRVTVRDTGIGIAPEHQEPIVQTVEPADGSAERVYGGTGLGLAVSRRLVELHGGAMTVRSTPGEGSVFSFTLPIASASASSVSVVSGAASSSQAGQGAVTDPAVAVDQAPTLSLIHI